MACTETVEGLTCSVPPSHSMLGMADDDPLYSSTLTLFPLESQRKHELSRGRISPANTDHVLMDAPLPLLHSQAGKESQSSKPLGTTFARRLWRGNSPAGRCDRACNERYECETVRAAFEGPTPLYGANRPDRV